MYKKRVGFLQIRLIFIASKNKNSVHLPLFRNVKPLPAKGLKYL